MVLSDFYILEHTQCIFDQHRCGAIQRHQVGGDRVAVNTHETDGKAGSLFAGQSGLKESHYALLSFAGAQQQDIGLPCPVDVSLSVGISGMPRQVRKGEPKIVAVGGGTPRKVHSRPKAAMARGWARKKAGSFQMRESSSSRSSGVGAALTRLDLECGIDIIEQAIVGVVDQLAFLALLHFFHRQPQLAPGSGRADG